MQVWVQLFYDEYTIPITNCGCITLDITACNDPIDYVWFEIDPLNYLKKIVLRVINVQLQVAMGKLIMELLDILLEVFKFL